jgi:hypothetical protein
LLAAALGIQSGAGIDLGGLFLGQRRVAEKQRRRNGDGANKSTNTHDFDLPLDSSPARPRIRLACGKG